MKKLPLLAVLLCARLSAQADVTLNGIFADHMVLQRDIPVSVYGVAEPGERVTVSFAGRERSATAGPDGTWRVTLAAMKASTNSAAMTVAGKSRVTIQDIVVGDVWVCSGQSNMDFTPGAYSGPNDPKPYDEKDFNLPLLRQFHIANRPSLHPETDVKANTGTDSKGAWLVCSPQSGIRFTAVGLYFGRKVQMESGIPIGLIKASWNGTRIEPWVSPDGLASVPELPAPPALPAQPAFDGGYPATWHCLYHGMIHRKDLVYSDPLYQEMQIEGGQIRILFDSVGSGLTIATKQGFEPVVKDPQGKLQRFAIAGADKQWVWANAVIQGATVVVSSPAVPNPVAVRYAFSMCPEGCNLYNREGLPASPFRTDAW